MTVSLSEALEAYTLEVHPAATIFPMIAGEEFDALVTSIGKEGLEQDIVLAPDGRLLDGRNRLLACVISGVEPRFVRLAPEYTDPIAFVVRMNLRRRQLTSGQLAHIALRVESAYAAEAKARQREGGRQYGERHPKQEVVEQVPQPLIEVEKTRGRTRKAESRR